MVRRRKGCKTIINCEHTEEKHYAKVGFLSFINQCRACVTSAITNAEERSSLSSASTKTMFIILKGCASLVISHNTLR